MKEFFGTLPSGAQSFVYRISCGRVSAAVTDLGATLVSLCADGTDVILGYDNPGDYIRNDGFLGAVVGRSANRIRKSSFPLGEQTVLLTPNEGGNNLHSGPDCFKDRLWTVEECGENYIRLTLDSPDGDQGYPGNAHIMVTYTILEDALTVTYDAVSDQDTVFNFTNHAYFNLFGEDQPQRAMDQILTVPGSWFLPDDVQNIPTGEVRPVEGTPFDFRTPKALGQDICEDYEPLILQGGYDHNFEAAQPVCAILQNPETGLTMTVSTDCPGVQVYTANFLDVTGKQGHRYPRRSAVCLETQFAPDSVHHPEWPQPFTKAGFPYHSETRFQF